MGFAPLNPSYNYGRAQKYENRPILGFDFIPYKAYLPFTSSAEGRRREAS
jgi:hypothetical protein